ncbi:MAG: twin-arginine translocase subunit TatC [Planctomycetes bacterium]|jgi:Tat protein translocase TatC|nr:twin-arginine translocase subunit TatC [Planctomycetota bacterium]MBT6453475.1 twin-arginine translocase subunit TatC [Planctomycetota bacterium]MBT6541186.1 twin-arginine translocase subunit TatC [Planctomycetota bacterium]MBT6969110.1 twin-arginine translocase subunit TatC [Planctomycetota bacterium]MBT7104181.1 twin-arginine translocase subunit TatC [Planctomycetota bacterium]
MVEHSEAGSEDQLKTMSFGDHLEELRSRVIRSLMVILIFGVAAFFFQDTLMELITGPHRVAMSQITARQEIQKLQEKISQATEELSGVVEAEAALILKISREDEDWWERWDQFRSSQDASPVVGRMARLIEERLAALDPARSSMRVLGATPERFQQAAAQLQLSLGDLPWGGEVTVQDCIDQLKQNSLLWKHWSQLSAKGADGPVQDPPPVVLQQDVVKPVVRVPDPQTTTTLEQVARLSIAIEMDSAQLSGWRQRAKPLALLSYSEAFFSYVKLSLMLGMVAALPWITYEMWKFIAAGLFDRERKAVRPFLPVAFLLLASGVSFAYLVLIPIGLSFLGGYGDPELLQATFTLKEYLSLVFTLILGMGIIFQLPLAMIFLNKSGILEVDSFRKYRKYAILGAVLIGAMLTPPDVVTQLLMAGPLTLLYEIGIIACTMIGKKKSVTD